jgi:hypothetical protein
MIKRIKIIGEISNKKCEISLMERTQSDTKHCGTSHSKVGNFNYNNFHCNAVLLNVHKYPSVTQLLCS